ncbi:endo-1,4-beta-xylanase [Desertivirga xinjiangensis]|uniref:endo-1,4-beta-xylanase n=1 Tax=Desertivirga xinjiangensis TaxID=539206 RepID=UPI00210C20D5|nr:endo-1,4-beta-xylanase [Pedobacter xinjiangensis]
MKLKKNYKVQLIPIAIAICIFGSCKKNSLFGDDEARTYSNKVDSVHTFSGNNRIKVLIAVPNKEIVRAKVFWNNRKEFKEVPISLSSWPDTTSTIIGPLSEGSYDFEIITYNANGIASSPIRTPGTVLGADFSHGLANRPVSDIYYENGTATIYWGPAADEVATHIIYTDKDGNIKKRRVAFGKDTTRIDNFKPGALSTTLQYQTSYRPVAAIDTFYADLKTETVITASLKELATAKGILFGSLISYGSAATHGVVNDGSPNGIYTRICKNEFNFGQASWGGTRWRQTPPSDFNDVNAVINFNKANYEKVFAQLIVGPNVYMPDWFKTGTFTPAQMDVLLRGLVQEFMETNDNKSKVGFWGVANEVFNNEGTYRAASDMKWADMGWEDDASGLTGTDKVNLKHPVFIGKAFEYSRLYTNAKLELRDYNFEFNTPLSAYQTKHKAFYQLVKHLKAKGYPVDAVGIQCHNNLGSLLPGGVETFKNTIKKFKDLGVNVYLTELDVITPKVNSAVQVFTPQLAELQKQEYYTIVKAAIEAGVDLISLWGVRDNNDPGWRFGQAPLLFDENYNRKPAYYGVQKALFDAKK